MQDDLLLEMDRDAESTVIGQSANEVICLLGKDGAVLLEGGRVELLVRHLPAHAPVFAVVHGSEVPAEARSARREEASVHVRKQRLRERPHTAR